MGARDWFAPPGLQHQVGEGKTREVLTHVGAHVRPDVEQDALTLVVAGSLLVGLAEVARHDWSINCGHDVGQGDGVGAARENVAPTNSALRTHEPHALQAEQNLFEIRLGEAGTFGEVAH